MSTGKICVSIAAETVAEYPDLIDGALKFADIIEIRFDFLTPLELQTVMESPELIQSIFDRYPETKFITTLRTIEQGGARDLSNEVRAAFWNSGIRSEFADVELDIASQMTAPGFNQKIVSNHDFEGPGTGIDSFVEKAGKANADIFKMAVTSGDAVDGLSVWQLHEIDGRQTVAIAMGESGKWTRILGPAFGAPFTYASPAGGDGTAPGQLSAREMCEVYRVNDLDRDTEIFGIIKNSVSQSFSPFMHNAAFRETGQNAVYIPFQVRDLKSFMTRMIRPETREIDWNLKGFSVTIPYKESIIELLDFIDETAQAIGAVNTVKVVGDHLVGSNTDATGFIEPLQNRIKDLTGVKTAVLGAGGAARACVYALTKAGADVTVFARVPAKSEDLAKDFGCGFGDLRDLTDAISEFSIAVNATPLGSRGIFENESPLDRSGFKNLQLAYDLVYNPSQTPFLREANESGVQTIGGLEMLLAQGLRQFELWTGTPAPQDTMHSALSSALK